MSYNMLIAFVKKSARAYLVYGWFIKKDFPLQSVSASDS